MSKIINKIIQIIIEIIIIKEAIAIRINITKIIIIIITIIITIKILETKDNQIRKIWKKNEIKKIKNFYHNKKNLKEKLIQTLQSMLIHMEEMQILTQITNIKTMTKIKLHSNRIIKEININNKIQSKEIYTKKKLLDQTVNIFKNLNNNNNLQ